MSPEPILDFRALVREGALFRPLGDHGRIEAFIPSMGDENHAANLLVLPNGDLLCAWFYGSMEGTPDVSIALSRLPSGASRWSAPIKVSDDATRSEQNPVLFDAGDGGIWLLYTAQETRGCTRDEWNQRVQAGQVQGSYHMQWTAIVRRRISHDLGRTWGPIETFSSKPSSFIRQPLVVLQSGRWILPMYYSVRDPNGVHGRDHTVMWLSDDRGASWREVPVPNSARRVQACVVEFDDGHLAAFFRSRSADRIYVSRSTNAGESWTTPERTPLPNNNSSIQALRLHSGALALVFNASRFSEDASSTLWPGGRYPLTIALSEDEGLTWPIQRHIDTGDGFAGDGNRDLNRSLAYPSIVQSDDRLLHVAYSYAGRQCIKYARFAEDWVRSQRAPLF